MNLFRPSTWFTRPGRSQAPPRPSNEKYKNLYYNKMCNLVEKEKKEKQLTESALNYGAPFDIISPWASFYDGLRLLFPLLPSRFDARISQSYIYLSQTQLDLLRSYGRWLYETNAYAQGALNGLANYSIGTGFQYDVSPRKYANPSKSLLKDCSKILADFQEKNKWCILEKQLFIRKKRDGDVFIRFYADWDGIAEIEPVEPECIRSVDSNPEWAFGIHVPDMDRPSKIDAFLQWKSPEEMEEVSSDWMVYLKNHTDTSVKRGLSDFFCIHETLYDAYQLNRATRQGESVRQAIAYIQQYAEAGPEVPPSIQDNLEDYTEPRFVGSVTNKRDESVHSVQPGETPMMGPGIEFVDGPKGSGDSFRAALHASLNQAGVKWCAPSWLLTGETDGAGYANSLVKEGLFVRTCEVDQHLHSIEYCGIMKRALQIAVSQGKLPEDTLQQVEIVAEGPPVGPRDSKAENEICKMLFESKVMSAHTWAKREGLDYDSEQEFIKTEPEQIPVLDKMNTSTSNTPGANYARETRQ